MFIEALAFTLFEARRLKKTGEPARAPNRSHGKMFDVLFNTEGSNVAEHHCERFHVDQCISGFDFDANDVTACVDILAARLSNGDKRRSDFDSLVFFTGVGVETFCSSRVST